MGFGVPAGNTVKSRPGRGLHVGAEKKGVKNNIAAARRQAVDEFTADIINRYAALVGRSLLFGAELGHKPFQVGGRCRAGLDGQPQVRNRVDAGHKQGRVDDRIGGDDFVDAPGAGNDAHLPRRCTPAPRAEASTSKQPADHRGSLGQSGGPGCFRRNPCRLFQSC